MGTLDLKIMDSLAKVFPDEEPAGAESLSISALRGETVSAVVAYWGAPAERKNWRVTVEAPGGIDVRLRSVELVPSSYPCHAQQDEDYLRTKPGLFPDLLRGLDTADGAYAVQDVPGQWRSLWLDVCSAQTGAVKDGGAKTKDAAAFCGDAEIVVRFCAADGTKKHVTLNLHVVDADIPEQKLLHTEWFHSDCLADYYHVEAFSEEHWAILENFIRCYASRGINTILTPVVTPALDTEVGGERTTVQLVKIVKEDGSYSFDFTELKRWITLCEKYGITHFEMAHLFTQWGAKHAPKIMAWENGEYRRIFGWETAADGEEYAGFLAQYLTALTGFLKEEGLQDRTFFHISDEPSENDLESYEKARELVLPYIKGFQTIDALSDPLFYERGLVELFAPANDHIEPFLEKKVEGLWTYYCTSQWKDVSNRFMSMPSARNRILGVQLYLYQIAGFLHWGFNFYNTQYSKKHLDPYAETAAGSVFPSGDSFLVYPGEGGMPEESVRLMVLYEALEDIRAFELLESLAGRERVCEIIGEGLEEPITFKKYPKDSAWLIGLRERINAEIEKAKR